ncbi:MAG: hypothetical protein ACE5F9_15865 [Phycisphaerae bacterium]
MKKHDRSHGHVFRILGALVIWGGLVAPAPARAPIARPPDDPPALDEDRPPPGPLAGPRPRRRPRGPEDDFGPPGRRPRPPGRFDRGDRGDRDGPPRLTPEDIDAGMTVLRDKLPDLYKKLSGLRERDPEAFLHAVRKLRPLMVEYFRLKERQPDMADTVMEEFRIEHQLRNLGRAYAQAREEDDTEAMDTLETNIRRLVERQFEIRMQRHHARLEDFRKRIEHQQRKLEKEVQRHKDEMARHDKLVDRRVEAIKSGKPRGFPGFRDRDRDRRPPGRFGVPEQRRGHGPRRHRGRPHDADGPHPDRPDTDRPDRPPPPDER